MLAGWRPASMARAYSLDLRERVVGAVAAGQSCRAVAVTFKVSVASVVKWSQRFRATGSAAAHKVGGRRPYALAGERAWLLGRLSEKPDITLRALAAELAERGIKVSYFAVWHFFEHEGISFKKKPARQRAGSPRRRQATSAVPSARSAPSCSFCRPTARTSIRSSRSSPSLRPCCVKPQSEPSKPPGSGSVLSSAPSHQPSAQTTSQMPDTLQNETVTL